MSKQPADPFRTLQLVRAHVLRATDATEQQRLLVSLDDRVPLVAIGRACDTLAAFARRHILRGGGDAANAAPARNAHVLGVLVVVNIVRAVRRRRALRRALLAHAMRRRREIAELAAAWEAAEHRLLAAASAADGRPTFAAFAALHVADPRLRLRAVARYRRDAVHEHLRALRAFDDDSVAREAAFFRAARRRRVAGAAFRTLQAFLLTCVARPPRSAFFEATIGDLAAAAARVSLAATDADDDAFLSRGELLRRLAARRLQPSEDGATVNPALLDAIEHSAFAAAPVLEVAEPATRRLRLNRRRSTLFLFPARANSSAAVPAAAAENNSNDDESVGSLASDCSDSTASTVAEGSASAGDGAKRVKAKKAPFATRGLRLRREQQRQRELQLQAEAAAAASAAAALAADVAMHERNALLAAFMADTWHEMPAFAGHVIATTTSLSSSTAAAAAPAATHTYSANEAQSPRIGAWHTVVAAADRTRLAIRRAPNALVLAHNALRYSTTTTMSHPRRHSAAPPPQPPRAVRTARASLDAGCMPPPVLAPRGVSGEFQLARAAAVQPLRPQRPAVSHSRFFGARGNEYPALRALGVDP